ncbi:MAG: YcgN family cysteine cluster protein [Paracoccaceae bacterium]
MRKKFWEKPLESLDREEWEALCDGCGKCCLLKLQDEDTGAFAYTRVACRLFDNATCRCGNYALRRQLVKGCVILTPETLEQNIDWMPATCAYRLRAEGKPLFDWHPLLSGDADTVHSAGISMKNRTLTEYDVDPDELDDHIIEGML